MVSTNHAETRNRDHGRRRRDRGGYHVAMVVRTVERLRTLEAEIDNTTAYVCDVGDLDALQATIQTIREDLGEPEILVHNAVAHSFETFPEGDPALLERNFRVNTTAVLYHARARAPATIAKGCGAIMVTGNTAALRGVPNCALFAPTKAAQRILAETLARDLGPKGIHVGYITVDAAIDVAWLGPPGQRPDWLEPRTDWPYAREDYFTKPHAIAEEVFHMAHQDRSTWAFDLVIRPFAERW